MFREFRAGALKIEKLAAIRTASVQAWMVQEFATGNAFGSDKRVGRNTGRKR
jgi:hypothetical protein